MKYKPIALLTLGLSLVVNQAADAAPKFTNPISRSRVVSSRPNRTRMFAANFVPVSGSLTYTIGGAVRNENACGVNPGDGQLVALTAENAATTQTHPEFFASIPELNGDKQGVLVVKNQSESYYEEAQVVIPANGGLLGFSLPDTAPALEEGEYNWFLQIQCGGTPLVEDPTIGGTVKRVAMDVPQMDSLSEVVEYHASNSIWHDSLSAAEDLAQQGDYSYLNALLAVVAQ